MGSPRSSDPTQLDTAPLLPLLQTPLLPPQPPLPRLVATDATLGASLGSCSLLLPLTLLLAQSRLARALLLLMLMRDCPKLPRLLLTLNMLLLPAAEGRLPLLLPLLLAA